MLNRVYELETAIFRSSQKESQLKNAVRQAKFDLREAKIAQVEYSGIRPFLDKLSGRYPDKAESLSWEVRKAEAELSVAERQLDRAANAASQTHRLKADLTGLLK